MKRKLMIFSIAFVIFFGVGMIKGALKIPDEIFWKTYWIIALLVIIVCIIVDIVWYNRFNKKVKSLIPILTEELNPDKYIEENEKLLKNRKSKVIIGALKLNISAGYCDKGEYQKAKEIMLGIPKKGVKGINRVIFDINMAYIYYRLGEIPKAQMIMKKNKAFSKFEKAENLGAAVAILNIFNLIHGGQKKEAKDKLFVSKQKWLTKRSEDDFLYLEKQIDEM